MKELTLSKIFFMQQLNLFGEEKANDGLPANLIVYEAHFFDAEQSSFLLQKFITELPWEQTSRQMYGKKIITPRLTAWFGDPRANYSLTVNPSFASPWTDELRMIKDRVDKLSGVSFNIVLLNYYRDGNDSVAWHSDNDGIAGRNKTVASVSFGQPRIFEIRNRKDHRIKYSMLLENGSYLLMKGNFQEEWQHRIPKSVKQLHPRVNLTYRIMPLESYR
jgi:alkylated DNA repair dioxygenase AlkB